MLAPVNSLSLEIQNSQYSGASPAQIRKPKTFCLKKNQVTKIMPCAVYTVID